MENKKLQPVPVYTSGYVRVEPHYIFRSGVRNDSDLQAMKDEIKRHIDGVDSVSIGYDEWQCPTCGEYYEENRRAWDCLSSHKEAPATTEV